MSKSTKIVVSLLIVAGFVCLAVGTIFACDYISQSNNSVALDKKQVIVASAERFALPNVRINEPLQDIEVPVDGFAPGVYRFDLSVVVPYSSVLPGRTLAFTIYQSSSYFDFTLLSTNLPNFDTYVGEVVNIELNYPSETSSFVTFYIEYPDDGVVSTILLDGTNTYFVEVQAFSSFFVSDTGTGGGMESYVYVPANFFTPVARGIVIVRELVGILTSGLVGIGQGLGESLSPIATAIFVNTAGDGLSVFGILIAVFAAISLGLSFTRFVLNFVTSWGNRNR